MLRHCVSAGTDILVKMGGFGACEPKPGREGRGLRCGPRAGCVGCFCAERLQIFAQPLVVPARTLMNPPLKVSEELAGGAQHLRTGSTPTCESILHLTCASACRNSHYSASYIEDLDQSSNE